MDYLGPCKQAYIGSLRKDEYPTVFPIKSPFCWLF
jgi:hypothetical protein